MSTSFVDAPGTFRPMLRLTMPVLLEQVLHLLVGFTDLWLTGNFLPDEAYVAAMTLMIYALWLVGNVFGFVALGSTAMTARFVGAGDRDMANRVMNQSIVTRPGVGARADGGDDSTGGILSHSHGPPGHGRRRRHALSHDRALRAAGRHGRARRRRLPPRRGRHGQRARGDGDRQRRQHGCAATRSAPASARCPSSAGPASQSARRSATCAAPRFWSRCSPAAGPAFTCGLPPCGPTST